MSYVRASKDSDVYVYSDVNDRSGEIRCCGCSLPFLTVRVGGFFTHRPDFVAAGPQEMILHLEEHRVAGHQVPPRAFTRLRVEAKERAKKPIVYPIHFGTSRNPLKWLLPICGHAYSAHFRKMLGAKWRRENPNGHAHPRDEVTINPKRVTCRECKKRMRASKKTS